MNIIIALIIFTAIIAGIANLVQKSGMKDLGRSIPFENSVPSPDFKTETFPEDKNFQFAIYDTKKDVEPGVWYRLKDWKYPANYFRMEDRIKGRMGALSPYEEKVMGIEFDDRWKNLVRLGDQPDFRIFLEREPNNDSDRNAIKVMCSATVDSKTVAKHLGYVPQDTAAALKGIDNIDVGSASVSFPTNSHPLILKILIV